MKTEYSEFLQNKEKWDAPSGLDRVPELNSMLFEFQKDIVTWALHRGRAAIFADCGLGKGPMALEWARHVPGKVLIVAPLAVSKQFLREAKKFGVAASVSNEGAVSGKITITNYERLHYFDCSQFTGVVLDESSILKSHTGQIRNSIIESFAKTPFRLCCTATPAPNDHMELGNHSEFLGVMPRSEMLAMYFTHDGGETSKWRIKGHAKTEFWKWMCSWAVMLRKPSDLGYSDEGYDIPALEYKNHIVNVQTENEGELFALQANTLGERLTARRESTGERVKVTAEIVNASKEVFLIWCNLNTESSELKKAIPGAVEIKGSDSIAFKEGAMERFTKGEIRVLVTKPKIAGFGMNWQHCHNVCFTGLSDSYEQFYQAVRRCWRFGQTEKVNVHIVTAYTEGAVLANIQRKEKQVISMAEGIVKNMKEESTLELKGKTKRISSKYEKRKKEGDSWTAHLGDCVDVISEIPDDSIHYTIYSPPFANLYTYSNSDRDMGNSSSNVQFMEHYKFMIKELMRVTMPGRLVSFHCMNFPTMKERDGFIGVQDFRGELIKAHQEEGWIYHSEVCIWKNPVVAMQRTKALGLLHKQIKKDSAMSRQGIPDYLVTMRKPGENPERITHTAESFPVDIWQNYASPVWMDINPSDTLQYRAARENDDERHICPLQLGVIRRGIELWSNEGDTVFSPFMGIGSEGFVALEHGRKFIGAELKKSYWKMAVKNLKAASVISGNKLF